MGNLGRSAFAKRMVLEGLLPEKLAVRLRGGKGRLRESHIDEVREVSEGLRAGLV